MVTFVEDAAAVRKGSGHGDSGESLQLFFLQFCEQGNASEQSDDIFLNQSHLQEYSLRPGQLPTPRLTGKSKSHSETVIDFQRAK